MRWFGSSAGTCSGVLDCYLLRSMMRLFYEGYRAILLKNMLRKSNVCWQSRVGLHMRAGLVFLALSVR